MSSEIFLPYEPEWIKNLMIYQLRIDEFSPDGTIKGMLDKVAYLEELGINAVWLTPVYEANVDPIQGNCPGRFCNFDVKEPHLLNKTYGSIEEFKNLVTRLHSSGIRVILETVPHGITFNGSLVESNPDWFKQSASKEVTGTWGMADFNWENKEFCQFWINTMSQWVLDCGVDGFRCDLEPHVTGYKIWCEVIRKCREHGKEIVVFSEIENTREGCYHFEQVGIGDIHATQGAGDYFLEHDIVDSFKNGTGLSCDGKAPYVTFVMSVHDTYCYHSKMSRLRFGYEMLFTPAIPIWFSGEEFGNTTTKDQLCKGVLFFNKINWDLLNIEKNKGFLKEVKELINIRNSDLEVFAPDRNPVKNSNIVKVPSTLQLQTYARISGNYAYIVAGAPGKAASLWKYQSGQWQVEYGSLSQRDMLQKESVATIDRKFEKLKEIKFSITTKICPDKDMSGLGGIMLGKKSLSDTRATKGYFIGICANQRVFVTWNGQLIAEKMMDRTPQQEISVKISFTNEKGRISIEGERSGLDFPLVGETNGYFSFVTSRAHVHFNDLSINANEKFKDDFVGKAERFIITPDFEKLGMKNRGVYRITDLLKNTSYDRVVQNGFLQIKGKVPGNELLLFKLEYIKSIQN